LAGIVTADLLQPVDRRCAGKARLGGVQRGQFSQAVAPVLERLPVISALFRAGPRQRPFQRPAETAQQIIDIPGPGGGRAFAPGGSLEPLQHGQNAGKYRAVPCLWRLLVRRQFRASAVPGHDFSGAPGQFIQRQLPGIVFAQAFLQQRPLVSFIVPAAQPG